MTKKLKERKKKAKEQKSRKRVLQRRTAIRKKNKADRDAAKLEKKTRPRLMPYIDPAKKDARIKAQLEHNMKVLEALESQKKELAERKKQINKELEEEGCLTLKQKLDGLEKKKNEHFGVDKDYSYQEVKFENAINNAINNTIIENK